jgi:hypothetical protein
MVKGKISEIASVTDEIVTDLAGRDKPRNTDGVQSFQPGQS